MVRTIVELRDRTLAAGVAPLGAQHRRVVCLCYADESVEVLSPWSAPSVDAWRRRRRTHSNNGQQLSRKVESHRRHFLGLPRSAVPKVRRHGHPRFVLLKNVPSWLRRTHKLYSSYAECRL
jgi:hypothetical protein